MSQYQRCVPDNRIKQKTKKTKSPVVSSELELEVEDEDSEEGRISFAEDRKEEKGTCQQPMRIPVKTSQNGMANEPNIPPVDRQSIEQIRTKNSPTLNPEAVPPKLIQTPKIHMQQSVLGMPVQQTVCGSSITRSFLFSQM